MVPRLKVAPLRRVLSLLEPAHSLGYVADARQRFSGRPDELEAASGASRLRHIVPASGDPRVHLVGARGSVEPRAPARDGLMERDAMMRIPFVLAQRLKAGECGAVVAGGDRGDEPPHPEPRSGGRAGSSFGRGTTRCRERSPEGTRGAPPTRPLRAAPRLRRGD